MSEQQPKLHEWFHKFLINFAMWAFALMGIAYAIRDIIFATENEATYKVLVIIMAVLLIALSLFIIKVRFDLAAFRSKAPQELLIACLAAAVIVFLINLLLYLQPACSPFLLKFFRDSLKLYVLIEAHYVLDVLAYGLREDIFLQEVAGLHSVEQEVLAKFLGQVGLDDLVYLLFGLCALCQRGGRAIYELGAVEVEHHAFNGAVRWIEDIGPTEDICLFHTQDHSGECEFQHDFRLCRADGSVIEQLPEMFLIFDFEAVQCAANGLEQSGLTTAVHAANQDDRSVFRRCQIQIKIQVGLVVVDANSLDNHKATPI